MKLQKALEGKKTYISVALLFCLGGAQAVGWVSAEQAETYRSFLVSFLGLGLYSKMNRM